MEEYKMIFQVIAFIFILVLVYYVYRFIIYSYRNNRLSSYTIKNKAKDPVFGFVDSIARKLMKIDCYKNKSKKYEKYLRSNSRYNGFHIFAFKFITGALLSIIYVFDCVLYKLNLNLLIMAIMYIFGYCVIDIILNIEYSNKVFKMDNNITKVMIIMNNNYKVSKNHKEVMERVVEEIDEPLKGEFVKVRKDLNHGIDISNALFRMYERTKIDKILYISELLGLNVKYGISIVDICGTLEKNIAKREKRENYLMRLNNTNKLIIILLALIPVFVIGLLIIMNYDLIMVLANKKTVILIALEVFVYFLYLFVMTSMIRGEL